MKNKPRFEYLDDLRDLGLDDYDLDQVFVIDHETGIVYQGAPCQGQSLGWEVEDAVADGSLDGADPVPGCASGEIRVVDPVTGGQKGRKPEEYALIPVEPLAELARVYGYGAKKYSPDNWRRGYAWSLSLSSLKRHVEAFRRGERLDSESGCHHLAHAAFHLFTLVEYDRTGAGTDDRGDVTHARKIQG